MNQQKKRIQLEVDTLKAKIAELEQELSDQEDARFEHAMEYMKKNKELHDQLQASKATAIREMLKEIASISWAETYFNVSDAFEYVRKLEE